jgi:hypothetical protein
MMTVDTSDLQAFRQQLHRARADIRDNLDKESKRFAPLLIRSAQTHARGEVEKRIAQSGTARIVKDGFVVTFGRSGRVAGAKLAEITRQYEFGTRDRNRFSEPYLSRHRISGKAMRVTRRTRRQLPQFVKTGRFLYPALADVTPDLVKGYVRAIVNTVTDA